MPNLCFWIFTIFMLWGRVSGSWKVSVRLVIQAACGRQLVLCELVGIYSSALEGLYCFHLQDHAVWSDCLTLKMAVCSLRTSGVTHPRTSPKAWDSSNTSVYCSSLFACILGVVVFRFQVYCPFVCVICYRVVLSQHWRVKMVVRNWVHILVEAYQVHLSWSCSDCR